MMRSWPTVSFSAIYAEPSKNGLTRPKSVRGSGYKMINMGEIFAHNRIKNPPMELVQLSEAEKEKFAVKKRDLLFARQSLVAEGAGKCSIVLEAPELTTFESHLIRVRLDQYKVDPLFYYYYFSSYAGKGNIQSLVMQVAAAGIRGSELANLTVPNPPLPTQRKIASILSAYDDLIENNTRRIKVLEEMAQMIYREWFVKFRFPGANVETSRRGVSNPINETCHRHVSTKMVDSVMGRIPEGWEVGKLQDFIELCYGKALKSEDRKEGPYPVYGSSGVVGYHSERLVDGPGIIVGRKGNVGSVHWTDDSFYPIDTVYYVKTNISLYYTFYNLQQQNFINNDAAVPGLNRNQAYALPFLMPAKKQMEAFDEVCIPVFSTLRNLRSKNENLRQTRDLLLPRLISGEVDVEGLEILTE